jgi:iron complex transport system ATP-binding protein
MLRVTEVDFGYGDAPVLRGASLHVDAGELVCIVGANGAGKSTLLRLAAGLLIPQRGTVRCFGEDPAVQRRAELARRVSFLPQEYRLTFPFTVAEVVLMGRYPHQPRGLISLESARDVERARAAMRRCDVDALAGRRFDELSGGERRRALLAQAFCQETELVMLDEPTASLDPAHAMSVFEALRAETRERGASAVAVTHDLNLAARYADRIAVLAGGRAAATGSPAEVLRSPELAAAFSCELHVGTLPGSDTPFVVPR